MTLSIFTALSRMLLSKPEFSFLLQEAAKKRVTTKTQCGTAASIRAQNSLLLFHRHCCVSIKAGDAIRFL